MAPRWGKGSELWSAGWRGPIILSGCHSAHDGLWLTVWSTHTPLPELHTSMLSRYQSGLVLGEMFYIKKHHTGYNICALVLFSVCCQPRLFIINKPNHPFNPTGHLNSNQNTAAYSKSLEKQLHLSCILGEISPTWWEFNRLRENPIASVRSCFNHLLSEAIPSSACLYILTLSFVYLAMCATALND